VTIRAASQPDKTGREFALTVGRRSLTICLCVLFAAFCLSSSIKARERTVGHVLDVEGEWYLDGRPGQALSMGEELPASGVIRIPSPSRFAYIVIRYSDNQIVSRRCRNHVECEQPILLPRAIQRQATIGDFIIEKALGVIRRNLVSPSVHSGRSADGALREAVVQIKDGQVDLAPVFTEMNDGTYYVRVERRTPDGKTADGGSAKQIKVRWNSVTAATTPAAKFQPGLYELVLLEKRGAEYKPTITTAWFLAGNLDQYAQTVAPFCEATRLTATWRGDVSEGTARSFLRAFLIHLASSPPAPTAK